jgi:hypothetical protein
LYFRRELRIKQKHSIDCVPQHLTKGIRRIYPEQVKSSQMIGHNNLEHISNVLGAFYVHNE